MKRFECNVWSFVVLGSVLLCYAAMFITAPATLHNVAIATTQFGLTCIVILRFEYALIEVRSWRAGQAEKSTTPVKPESG